MAASREKQFRYITYGIVIIAILLLIAGAVMLGIALSKMNPGQFKSYSKTVTINHI